MIRFNLYGDVFTHLTGGNRGYSTHGKVSRYIEWVKNGSGEAAFYVDYAISYPIVNPYIDNYAWIIESKYISQASNHVRVNPEHFLEKFKYIFTHEQDLLELDERFKFLPATGSWIKQPGFPKKTKLVSMISSDKTMTVGHGTRLRWVKRLQDQLDLYGRGFNEIEFKEQGLNDYMFSVAIENGFYETYFTEKLLDCFLTGTIPIYLGAPDIGRYFNTDGIIVLTDDFSVDQLSLELYVSKLDAVVDNYKRALKMEVTEDYLWEKYFS